MKQQLINKYLEGNSTLEEEKQLKELLSQTSFESLSEQEKEIFCMLSFGESFDASDDEEDIFNEDFSAEYDRIIQEQEASTAIIEELPQVSNETKEKPKIISMVWKFAAIAAVVALLLTFALPMLNTEDKQMASVENSIQDENSAIEKKETKKQKAEKQATEKTSNRQQTAEKDSVEQKIPSAHKFVRQPMYRPLMAKAKAEKAKQADSAPINVNSNPTASNQIAANQLDEESKQRKNRVDDIVNQYIASVEYEDPF